jgi:hypothetical protein
MASLTESEFSISKAVKLRIVKQKISSAQNMLAFAAGFFDKIKKISHAQLRKDI